MDAWEAVKRVIHAIDKINQQLPVPAIGEQFGTYDRGLVEEINQIANDKSDVHHNQGAVVGRSILETEISNTDEDIRIPAYIRDSHCRYKRQKIIDR